MSYSAFRAWVRANKLAAEVMFILTVVSVGTGVWDTFFAKVNVTPQIVAVVDPAAERIQATIERARTDILEDADRRSKLSILSKLPQAESFESPATTPTSTATGSPFNANHDDNRPQQRFVGAAPIVVVSPMGDIHYQDKDAAATLSGMLPKTLIIATSVEGGALSIEVSKVSAWKESLGRPCPAPNESIWTGWTDKAEVTIQMVWAGGRVERLPEKFSVSDPTCDSNPDLAVNSALAIALTEIRDTVLALASHHPASVANQ